MVIFFSYITQPYVWYEKVLSFSRISLQAINTQRFIPAALIKMMFSINMEIEAVWSEATHVPACFLIAHELILFMRERKRITTTLALTRPVLFQPYTIWQIHLPHKTRFTLVIYRQILKVTNSVRHRLCHLKRKQVQSDMKK